ISPLCFSVEWHFRQYSDRSGRIALPNETSFWDGAASRPDVRKSADRGKKFRPAFMILPLGAGQLAIDDHTVETDNCFKDGSSPRPVVGSRLPESRDPGADGWDTLPPLWSRKPVSTRINIGDFLPFTR